jgi:peptidoglycan-associated lipoprotein
MLVLFIPSLMVTLSCVRSKTILPDAMEQVAAQPELEPSEDQCREPAAEVAVKTPEPPAPEEFSNDDIQFDYDSSDLTPDARELLRKKAEWMSQNPDKKATIEAHCDERGTNEYNLALGDRRAQSAMAYMVEIGVPQEKLTAISYGEERPVDPGHDESAWAKNRRVHFVFE